MGFGLVSFHISLAIWLHNAFSNHIAELTSPRTLLLSLQTNFMQSNERKLRLTRICGTMHTQIIPVQVFLCFILINDICYIDNKIYKVKNEYMNVFI